MASVVVVHPAGAADELRRPRDDALVRERLDGGGDRFVAEDGPFRHYERTLEPAADGTGIAERTTFHVAVPFWGLLFVPGFRHAFGRPLARRAHTPWWAPPERLDVRAAGVLGLLCSLTLAAGYLGTLMSQTATFASDEFGASTTAQSGALAATRIGVLVVVVLSALADRAGRRRMVGIAAVAGCLTAATGALAPNLPLLTLSQIVSRGFATALLLLIAIVSTEEMPGGSRAYAYSLLTMTAALGSGMCLWFLPVADLDERAWRVLYVLPLLFLPMVAGVLRSLPETKRFAAPHVEAPVAGHGRRFWLLAVTGALLAVFAAPASQLGNEFLRDERGFSAARVVLFTTLTVTPGGLGIIVGGRLADIRGRRAVAAIGITGGTILVVGQYVFAGWPMWATAVFGSILAGAVAPSYSVYRSELFPTSLRGKLGGIVEALSVAGSAIGLLLVGSLVDGGWSYGRAFAWLAVAPLAVAVVVLAAFPETAHRELEDINPEDRATTS